jgi:hypothetical protein
MLPPCCSVRFVGQRLSHRQLRWKFIPAVRAAIRILEPLLDAFVAKDMFTLRKANRVLDYAFWVTDAKFIVADDAS